MTADNYMPNTTHENPNLPSARPLGSGTALHCDHVAWGMNAILMTPVVATTSAVSITMPAIRYPAGAIMGIWLSMWLVVLWAWLTRKSPNTELRRGGDGQ
jgi:hypothetical protein